MGKAIIPAHHCGGREWEHEPVNFEIMYTNFIIFYYIQYIMCVNESIRTVYFMFENTNIYYFSFVIWVFPVIFVVQLVACF